MRCNSGATISCSGPWAANTSLRSPGSAAEVVELVAVVVEAMDELPAVVLHADLAIVFAESMRAFGDRRDAGGATRGLEQVDAAEGIAGKTEQSEHGARDRSCLHRCTDDGAT